jgi:hypothetical protein
MCQCRVGVRYQHMSDLLNTRLIWSVGQCYIFSVTFIWNWLYLWQYF